MFFTGLTVLKSKHYNYGFYNLEELNFCDFMYLQVKFEYPVFSEKLRQDGVRFVCRQTDAEFRPNALTLKRQKIKQVCKKTQAWPKTVTFAKRMSYIGLGGKVI